MNGRIAKMLRKQAEKATVGRPEDCTRAVYQKLKKTLTADYLVMP